MPKLKYQHFEAQEREILKKPQALPTAKDLQASRLANVTRPCKPQILVFRGAGVLGSAYPGFLLELEKEHLLEGVNTAAGSSAGGLVAVLVAVGYSATETKEIMLELRFDKLVTNPKLSLSQKFLNFFRGKLDTGTILRETVEALIIRKLGTPQVLERLGLKDKKELKNLTFSQLHSLRDLGTRDLYLTGTNKTNNNNIPKGERIFCFGNTPNMPIALAAQITASHPFIYAPVEYEGNKYTDGAVSNPFPMHFFNQPKFVPKGYKLNEDGVNPSVLGVAIDPSFQIKKQWNPHTRGRWWARIRHFFYEYIFRPLAFFGLYNRKHDHAQTHHRTQIIQSHDLGIHSLNFDIKREDKERLIEGTQLETIRHLRHYHGYDVYLPPAQLSSFKNFKAKYENCDKDTIERIINDELSPAIKRYNDRQIETPDAAHLAEGLAVYQEEHAAATEALGKLKISAS